MNYYKDNMNFLDSLETPRPKPKPSKRSRRVRSWYLYEQYKSLEKNQLNAAKTLMDRVSPDRYLRKELLERNARRSYCGNLSNMDHPRHRSSSGFFPSCGRASTTSRSSAKGRSPIPLHSTASGRSIGSRGSNDFFEEIKIPTHSRNKVNRCSRNTSRFSLILPEEFKNTETCPDDCSVCKTRHKNNAYYMKNPTPLIKSPNMEAEKDVSLVNEDNNFRTEPESVDLKEKLEPVKKEIEESITLPSQAEPHCVQGHKCGCLKSPSRCAEVHQCFCLKSTYELQAEHAGSAYVEQYNNSCSKPGYESPNEHTISQYVQEYMNSCSKPDNKIFGEYVEEFNNSISRQNSKSSGQHLKSQYVEEYHNSSTKPADDLSDEDSVKSEESARTVSARSERPPPTNESVWTYWAKLVAFAHRVIQLNHGNCYYDYSSQFLTAVLACDVICRGVNRFCNYLQPYVLPIKFDEANTPDRSKDHIDIPKCRTSKKSIMKIKTSFHTNENFKFPRSTSNNKKKYNCERNSNTRRPSEGRRVAVVEPTTCSCFTAFDQLTDINWLDDNKNKKSKLPVETRFKTSGPIENPMLKLSGYMDSLIKIDPDSK